MAWNVTQKRLMLEFANLTIEPLNKGFGTTRAILCDELQN
jgi:hypothetical protein